MIKATEVDSRRLSSSCPLGTKPGGWSWAWEGGNGIPLLKTLPRNLDSYQESLRSRVCIAAFHCMFDICLSLPLLNVHVHVMWSSNPQPQSMQLAPFLLDPPQFPIAYLWDKAILKITVHSILVGEMFKVKVEFLIVCAYCNILRSVFSLFLFKSVFKKKKITEK